MSETIHPSTLQSYLYCPKKALLEHFDPEREEIPQSKAAARGTILHRLIEVGPQFCIGDYQDIVKDVGQEAIEIVEATEILGELWRQLSLRDIEILEQEKTLQWEYLAHQFEGTLDAIVRFPDTPKGMVDIVDWKSGQHKPCNEALRRNVQLALYWIGAKENGYDPYRVWWVHLNHFQPLKRASRGRPAGSMRGDGFFPVRISHADVSAIKELISPILGALHHGIFPPSPSTERCMSCQVSHRCPSYGGEVEEVKVGLL